MDSAFIVGLLSGAAAGALLTGVFDLLSKWTFRAQAKRDLRVGLAAEIRVGLQSVDPEAGAQQVRPYDLHFIARNAFPYEFFKANQNKIGLLPEKAASDVVEYHALLWQFYEKAKILNKKAESHQLDKEALATELKEIMIRIHKVGSRALRNLRPKRRVLREPESRRQVSG